MRLYSEFYLTVWIIKGLAMAQKWCCGEVLFYKDESGFPPLMKKRRRKDP
jgi:hypothetical protein